MLEVRRLSKAFPLPKKKKSGPSRNVVEGDPRREGKRFYAVKEVSFRAETGAILGLLGPNGAGKTTLLRMLSTALEPTSGTAEFDGVDIAAAPIEVRKKIGFLSGTTGLYGRLTAREMVAYYGDLHGMDNGVMRQRMSELFDQLGIEPFADMRNDQLSTGMKQKVSIARTLIHDPEVIIFDEPTTGLDVAAAETVLAIIEQYKEAGRTVLFSTHHMHEVELLCSQVIVIEKGRLCFEGSVAEMRQKSGEDKLDRAFLRLVGQGENP
ncbi:MAG: ATP-binding cassette domain-containing protein [Proteobacteria bacterium]|nr:ATP-binding cassette domain-containing protein [Pseudomonadota bacterium]